jgi:predicted DNA-binding transcriptional regulator YafY
VPIYGESGPGGGIQLVGGYETRLTGLTGPEATALGLAGIPTAAAELGLGGVLVAAQSKVDAALPPELRTRAARLRERFLVDVPGWFRAPEAVPALAALAGALWDGKRVDIEYRRPSGTVRRRLDPLGLVLKGSTWYLVALARDPAGIRTFRVGRVGAVTVLDEPADRPAGFDLAGAWADIGASFDRDLRRYVVHALVPGDELWRLRHALPEPSATRAIDSAGPPGPDGRRAVVVHSESLEVAHDELLRVGRALEVTAPLELRDALAATGRALATHHRGPAAPTVG